MTRAYSDFYRGPKVWVEDEMTRVMLVEQWGGVALDIVAANGRRAVKELIAAVPLAQQPMVHGIIDRDFDDEDANWHETTRRVYVLPAHEAENLLLRFDAMAAIEPALTEMELHGIALGHATRMVWLMACRDVLRRLACFTVEIPKDPRLSGPSAVTDEPSAMHYLEGHRLGERIERAGRELGTHDALERRLLERHRFYEGNLQSGAWLRSFSGKEIFRHLRTSIPGLRGRGHGNIADLDLARRILRHMRGAHEEIEALATLRGRLLARSKAAS